MKSIVIRQSILNHPWPILFSVVIFLIPVCIYWFSTSTPENGNDPEILGVILPMLITSTVMGFALSMKNEIIIEKGGIRYRKAPFFKSTRFLSVAEITQWDIVDYSFRNFRGLGYRRDIRGNGYYVMKMGKALKVRTERNRTFYFGIDKETRVRQFIREHWDINEMKNGR
ncbi:MAG: hypothetical protein ACPF9D_03380 [Owenweeksia sp.]